MTWPAFTAAAFLAALAHERPAAYRADPDRVATVAQAAECAQSALMAQWHRHPRLFGALILEGILAESSLDSRVHSGDRRGLAGEVCLMQIGVSNGYWQTWAESREELAGVEVEPTTRCILSGIETLLAADRYCSTRNPKRNWLQMTWQHYRTGYSCHMTKTGKDRASETNRLAWTDWESLGFAQRLRVGK
jgi:hypothetical protein